ncbi:lasso peptide biosynthesis B2 protein [Spirosoma aerophilum]
MRRLKKLWQLSFQEKQLFAEALFWVFLAKALLLCIPLKRCLELVKMNKTAGNQPTSDQLRQVKKAIYRTRYIMFWPNQCIVMSVASRWMLQSRHIHSSLFLGVRFDTNRKLTAHAWLTAHDYYIVEKNGNYHELYYF